MNDTPNCLDFRRALMTDPRDSDEALMAHARECSSCRAFMQEARTADNTLRRALGVEAPESLSAKIRLRRSMAEAGDDAFESELAAAVRVPVPDDLKARIMDRNVLSIARARKRGRVMQFALAASVAVAVATGSILFLAQPGGSGSNSQLDPVVAQPGGSTSNLLLDAVVAHSQYHSSSSTQPIDDDLITPVLRLVGLEFGTRPKGVITAATACDVREQRSLHLVMRGDHGPVNVYVMPGQRTARTVESSESAWRGLVVPVRHGSLAVVGDPREQLDKYATSVRDSLRWRM